ncbi:hypothetical protein PENTCL1PPCAC_5658, partial [Pristionchus entomophagus]
IKDQRSTAHLSDLVDQSSVGERPASDVHDRQNSVSQEVGHLRGSWRRVQRREHIREHPADLEMDPSITVASWLVPPPPHPQYREDQLDVMGRAGGDVGEDPRGFTSHL